MEDRRRWLLRASVVAVLLTFAGRATAATFTLPGVNTASGPFSGCAVVGNTVSCPGNVVLANNDDIVLSATPVILDVNGDFIGGRNSEINAAQNPADLILDVAGNLSPGIRSDYAVTLIVGGNLNGANRASFEGDATIAGNANLGNRTTFSGDLTASGNVNVSSNVNLTGDLDADDVSVNGSNSTIDGNVSASGNVSTNGAITGTVNAAGDVSVSGSGSIGGNVIAGGNVNNNNVIGGSVDAGGDLNNNGGGTVGGAVTAGGNVNNNNVIGGGVVAGGDVNNNGGGEIGGPVTSGGNVNNNNIIGGDVDASGDVNNNGGGTVEGDVAAGGNVNNSGTIDGNVESPNTVNNSGTVTGDINAPTINGSGSVGGTTCDQNSNVGPCGGSGAARAAYLFEEDPFLGTFSDEINGFALTAEGSTGSGLVLPALGESGEESTCRYGVFPGGDSGATAGNVDLGIGGTQALTAMAWMRWGIPPSSGEGWANIVTSNDSGDTGQFWLQHRQDNGFPEFAVQTTSGRTFVQASTPSVEGEWQHVAGVYDGSQLRIYVNGALAGQSARTGAIRAFTAQTALSVGRWKPGSGSRRFQGDIDEVRIFGAALSQSEIQAQRALTRPCGALMPDLLIVKSSQVLADPVNGSNPKRIPGARIRYTVQVSNFGPGRPDAASLAVRDALPEPLELRVDGGAGAIGFADPGGDSGVSFNLATDVRYSAQANGGAPFDHAPTDNGVGVDPAIRGLEFVPGGRLSGHDGIGAAPMFQIFYEVILE